MWTQCWILFFFLPFLVWFWSFLYDFLFVVQYLFSFCQRLRHLFLRPPSFSNLDDWWEFHHCWTIWQCRLWIFQTRGTKLERFLPKNQCNVWCIENRTNHSSKILMSLVWFLLHQTLILRIGSMGRCQKLCIILESKI